MTTARRLRRAATAKAAKNGVSKARHLTEAQRTQQVQLLQPHLLAKREAEKMIAAVGNTFLAALGFPPNGHLNLNTGEFTLPPVAAEGRRPVTPPSANGTEATQPPEVE